MGYRCCPSAQWDRTVCQASTVSRGTQKTRKESAINFSFLCRQANFGAWKLFLFFCLVPEVSEEHALVAASTFPQRVLLANLLWFLDVACCFWGDKEIKSCYTTTVGFRCLDIVRFWNGDLEMKDTIFSTTGSEITEGNVAVSQTMLFMFVL